MAGPSKALVLDPALQKYQDYSKNRYKYFRWTPRNAWTTIIYAAVIPVSLGYLTYKTDGKFNFRGKRRQDSILEY